MNEIDRLLACLEQSPLLLEGLLKNIPGDLLKTRRIKSKWSIHEHACHVAVSEKYAFHKRFASFLEEDNPEFQPVSGESFAEDFYSKMDLGAALKEFHVLREKTLKLINEKSNDSEFWSKPAQHPEYKDYNPLIMTRHLLMHEHLHFYRIEELWLTNDDYLPG